MFNPTHQHADGGFYRFHQTVPGKSGDDWVPGVLYQSDDGSYRWTTQERWDERFTALTYFESQAIISDDEELVGHFVFRVTDAGDVRHMMASMGPQPNSPLSREWVGWMKDVMRCAGEAVGAGLHVRDIDYPDLMGDVAAFHAKFGQEYLGKPRMLPLDLHDFRTKFHDEETHEYRDEYPRLVDAVERRDRRDILNALELQLDALVDAIWVVLGTADLQFGRGTFFEAWKRVVKANMAKVIAAQDPNAEDSGREIKYDIRKPAGWEAPDHRDLLQDNAIFDEVFGFKGLDAPEPTESARGSYSDTRAI